MTTQRPPWRFYGRKGPMDYLANLLEFIPDRHNARNGRRQFSTYKIRGRRGLGKTALVQQMSKLAPADLPVIYYELPNPDSVPPSGEPISVEAIRQQVCNLVDHHGSGTGRLGEKVRRVLSEDFEWTENHFKFQALLRALIKVGAVVVLDEFHLAKDLGLVTDVKQVINDCHSSGRKLYNPGKLVLMGSHQQNLEALFTSAAPLYGRTNAYLHLHPWSLETTMTMAAEQGILSSPGKFLTLWTSYGGIPRNWERYCTDELYLPLHAIDDEDDWRRAFLSTERTFLTEPKERFDARTFIELERSVRDILLWIGRNHPRGVQLNDIPFSDFASKLTAVQMLETELDLMSVHSPVGQRDHSRWKISAQYTLFQIHVFPELMTRPEGKRVTGFEDEPELPRLLSLEGSGLENLAATYMAEQEGVTWSQSNVWNSQMAKDGDIDVMAINRGAEPWTVWLGEAKRSENQLRPGKIKSFQDRFLTTLEAGSGVKKVQNSKLHRLLFATTFTKDARARMKTAGFETLDIHSMARNYGIEPNPGPVALADEKDMIG